MERILNRSSQTPTRKFLRNHSTLQEKLLWEKLKSKHLLGFKFRRQHGIGNYIVDFYCPKLKLAIEIDGESHERKNAFEYDKNREEDIALTGIEFIRFTNDEILNELKNVLSRIESKVKERVEISGTPPRFG